MLTAFFTLATVAFFASIVTSVVVDVATTRTLA